MAITSKFYNIEGVLRLLQHPALPGVAGEEEDLAFMDVHDEMEGGVQALLIIHCKGIVKDERKSAFI